MPQEDQPSPPSPAAITFSSGPWAMEPTDHGLKPLIYFVNQNKSFLFLNKLSQVFCHSNEKLTEALYYVYELMRKRG
jgi:hypothetical protein